MKISRARALLASGALALAGLFSTAAAAAPAPATAHAPALTVPAPPTAADLLCPRIADPLAAAADRRVDVRRITPAPVYRTTCDELYRADGRGPDVVFAEGFQPKAPINGQYDVASYVDRNQPSPYVSTTYDHDLYKKWKSAWNYYIDAPGGIDVNKTIGTTHRWAFQHEVAFPGGVASRYIVGACPVNTETRTEILPDCVRNPEYLPWHLLPAAFPTAYAPYAPASR
ncbi:ADP-ribosyltransferase [Phaeacidiphilus oryzae]|uniref:ADP-ribosyltransferase n=1 Tax=Phaeacidiphilus oryzae TaxID=348818 RepID=UPI0006925494|nr:ADP-ribosyltransferase [Phaeacidiphilus oryzae]